VVDYSPLCSRGCYLYEPLPTFLLFFGHSALDFLDGKFVIAGPQVIALHKHFPGFTRGAGLSGVGVPDADGGKEV